MKKLIVILALILSRFFSEGQSAANFNKVWIQGGPIQYKTVFNGNLVTNNFFDTTHGDRYLADGGNSCISDSLGNLILYSDGYTIYDKNASVLDEGDTSAKRTVHPGGWMECRITDFYFLAL